ncbi:MAG: hypothetical protein ACPG5T_07475 [Endozoicomonas sp.]
MHGRLNKTFLGGRPRFRAVCEIFGLKNRGYELEHNYDHDKEHLATNLAYLTFLAFLVGQIQQLLSYLPIGAEGVGKGNAQLQYGS